MADTNPFAEFAPLPETKPSRDNPFAEFAPLPEDSGEKKRQYKVSEIPAQAIMNAPGSASKFASGIVQMVTSPIETAKNVGDVAAGALRNTMPKAVVDFVDRMDRVLGSSPETVQRITSAANAAGGVLKDRYGDADAIKRTLAEDPVGSLADISTIFTAGAGAARGLGTAARAAGATQTGNALARAGGVLSAAGDYTNPLSAITRPAKAAGNMLANVIDPKSAAYLAATQGKSQEVLNALRAPSQIVPGSMPTAAQAASSAGAVNFSEMGNSLSKLPAVADSYYARAEANKAAQIDHLRKNIGQTPEAVEAATTARTQATRPGYEIADREVVRTDPQFMELVNRPSMNKVMERAKRLAAEKGTSFEIGSGSGIVDAAGNPLSMGSISGANLHYMKQAFDDLIKTPEQGMGASEVNAIKGTRAQFMKWFEDRVPEYGTTRREFARLSEPINQMNVGQYLEGKLTPALGQDTAQLKANAFATAVENAPSTIKKSTGEVRFNKLEQILTPEQIQVVNEVSADLARAQVTERQAASTLGAVKVPGREGGLAPQGFTGVVTNLATELFQRSQGKLSPKLAVEVAQEMLNPSTAANRLSKAMTGQKVRGMIGSGVNALARGSVLANSVSAVPPREE